MTGKSYGYLCCGKPIFSLRMMPGFLSRLVVSVFCILIATAAHAGVIKGVVRDKKGETVPYASVFVPGSTMGTAANADGAYQLTLPPGNYTISCQSIGYKQASFSQMITGSETVEHNFTLQDEGLAIKEVVVRSKDEDPAYRIIRQAIKQRDYHLKQVKAFQAAIYLKGVIRTTEVPNKLMGFKIDKNDLGTDSNGKGVIYLLEEQAQYYSQRPDKQKTVIHSVRESGNSQGVGFSQLPSVITFYESNVSVLSQVAPRGLISPIAGNAVNYYKYKLEGEFVENHQIIYKIKVTPRRQFEPVFNGTIYIADGDWAIHSLSLEANASAGLNFVESIRIDQQFVSLRKDTWVIQRQVFYPVFNILGFGLNGSFVTVYNGQKVNEPVPDSVFNKKVISVYDPAANKRDTAYWSAERPIPLEQDEVKDYRVKDSIAAAPRDTARRDSLRRRANGRFSLLDPFLGKTFSGRKGSLSFGGLLFSTNYNSVEGLNIAPIFTYTRALDSGGTLTAKFLPRYGFENRHFNAMAGLNYAYADRAWRTRGWNAGIEGGKYVFQYNDQNPVNPLWNTISTLLYNQNYLKLYERYDAAVYYRANMGNGFSWAGKLNFQRRLPLENTSSYSWAKGSRPPMTDNVPDELKGQYWETHNALLLHLGVAYRPGVKYVQYPDYKAAYNSDWPLFSLSYDKGISGVLDSRVNYDKWRFSIEGDQSLKLFGTLSYNLSAGGFINNNTVAIPDMMHLLGNEYFLSAPFLKSFQIAPYYKFSNTANIYGEAHVEYNLYGLLTNKIPLFRRLNWYFILGNNTFYAGEQNYYTEAFLAVDNIGFKIYRLLRVDFVHSWESNGRNRTGIRIGLRMGGILGTGKGRNGEW